jgi:uncharacterized protein DUF6864
VVFPGGLLTLVRVADELAQIRSGDRELLYATAFILFADQETSIQLRHGGETLTFLLRFDDTNPGLGLAQRFEPVDEHTLRVTLVNASNPLGVFTNEPIEIGTIGQRPLSFLYRIDQLQATKLKHVVLTFYLGSPARG